MTKTKKKTEISKTKEENKFSDIYFDPKQSASFGGKKKLQHHFSSSLDKKKVEHWLPTQLAYSLHKPIRKKFSTRPYRVAGLNELWQIDLMEMIPYAKSNKGYKYVAVCIDVFSRFAFALPTKSKTGAEIAPIIARMIESSEYPPPKKVQTDLGKEFYNKNVKEMFNKYSIQHYSVNSQFKAAIVERFIRTLREKLNRYFTHTGKKVWVDVLPSLILSYNSSPHRSLFNMKPIDITSENEFQIWEMKQRVDDEKKSKKTKGGPKLLDYVRISRISTSKPFNRNFDQNWSDEIFRIVGIDEKVKPTMYIIEDEKHNVIDGKFYKEELQVIGIEKPSVYRIEKILSTKGKGNHKQYLVKWHGYSNEYNTWISANNVS